MIIKEVIKLIILISLGSTEIPPPDSNVSESSFWMSTDKPAQNHEEHHNTTPIFVGAIIFLCLILAAIISRYLWKKMTGARLLMDRGNPEMQTMEVVGEIIQVDDVDDHFYEDLDEQKAMCGKMEEKKTVPENDYVDSLAFAKKEKNTEERESKHFYDALK
jgi:hypothetical protein